MARVSFEKNIRIQKLQNKNRMIGKQFNVLEPKERREIPWLGSYWFEPGREQERADFLADWEAETKRLLKLNPDLKIVR